MTAPRCAQGVGITGDNNRRCHQLAVAGSMYCAEHRDQALRRVATLYNAELDRVRGLRWRGVNALRRPLH